MTTTPKLPVLTPASPDMAPFPVAADSKDSSMTPVEILKAARELISVPEHWTQEVLARDEDGQALTWGYNPMAVCWCSMGALEKVVGNDGDLMISLCEAENALEAAAGRGKSIGGFNDTHTHAEVLALFDRAIASAEQPLLSARQGQA